MTRALVLALALFACAPTFALQRADRKAPFAAYVVDMAMFSAGSIVGIGEFNARPEQRDNTLMLGAFAVAAAFWLPFWFVETR